MKTHVLKIDESDDLISIRDKMMWTKMPRLLLVFPDHFPISKRNIDLLLLKRYAAKLGAQLAVVTSSHEIRLKCKEHRIQFFKDTVSAQRNEWEESSAYHPPEWKNHKIDLIKMRQALSRIRSQSPSSIAIRIIFFALGILAVALVFLVFLPSASIQLFPEIITQSLTMIVHADQKMMDREGVDTIRMHSLSTTVENSHTLSVSGTTVIPVGFASGVVRFDNITESVVGIPSGTVVSVSGSPSVRFATQEDIVLPAGIGEQLIVPIIALKAGLEANVLEGTIGAIEGGLGSTVSVTNPFPITGGTEEIAFIATKADRLLLHQILLTKLTKECENKLKSIFPSAVLYFPDTLVVKVENEQYYPAGDQSGETVSLIMKLECGGQYVTIEDLLSLSEASLDTIIPKGYLPYSKPIILENSQPSIIDGRVEWEMTVERSIHAQIDLKSAAMFIIGCDIDTAASRIDRVTFLDEPPIITITPTWWPRIPLIPFRITFLTPETE